MSEMSEDDLIAVAQQMVGDYRSRLAPTASDEMVIVLPRWVYEKFGQERLTASLNRVGIQNVEVTEDWQPKTKAQMLVYTKGTWHAGHGIGETDSDCAGCQHAKAVAP